MYNLWHVNLDIWAICVLILWNGVHGGKEYLAGAIEPLNGAGGRLEQKTAVANCPPCTKERLASVQQTCLEEGQTLSDLANDHKEAAKVCDAFEKLLICVAQNVPQCLETMGEKFQYYTMTPWDCQMTTEHVKLFQKYLLEGCKAHDTDGDKDDDKDDQNSNSPVKGSSGRSGVTTYEVNTTSSNSTSKATCFHKSMTIRLSRVQYLLFLFGYLLL